MQNPTITNLNEVNLNADSLEETDFATREQQVWLLTNLFNGGVDLMRAFGIQPYVTVTYSKQTDAASRIGGKDYKRAPGISMDAHAGAVTKAWRTKKGALVLRIADNLRQNWTTVKLEGIKSITPGLPMSQDGLVGPVPPPKVKEPVIAPDTFVRDPARGYGQGF